MVTMSNVKSLTHNREERNMDTELARLQDHINTIKDIASQTKDGSTWARLMDLANDAQKTVSDIALCELVREGELLGLYEENNSVAQSKEDSRAQRASER
jgi:hypothetical protein